MSAKSVFLSGDPTPTAVTSKPGHSLPDFRLQEKIYISAEYAGSEINVADENHYIYSISVMR